MKTVPLIFTSVLGNVQSPQNIHYVEIMSLINNCKIPNIIRNMNRLIFKKRKNAGQLSRSVFFFKTTILKTDKQSYIAHLCPMISYFKNNQIYLSLYWGSV